MRIGLVCPYSLDVAGGVQVHVVELARSLRGRGHEVEVLAPGDADEAAHVTSAGRAVPVPYNGSVARLAFGPTAVARTRRWLRDLDADLLHVHEPATPSVSLIALHATTTPAVGTFHTSLERSRAMALSEPVLRPALEKLSARIAVSAQARAVVESYVGGASVVIPNGLRCDTYAGPRAPRSPGAPTIAFVGRFGEPRKGFEVLARALPTLVRTVPGVRVVVAGSGDPDAVTDALPREVAAVVRERVEFAGVVDDAVKADLLRGAAAYVAPHLGGESFGIVLVEAMAAGAPVVASDLPAFRAVLGDGRWGRLVRVGDPEALAAGLAEVVTAAPERVERLSQGARAEARRYDWDAVAPAVVRVYDAVLGRVPTGERGR